MIRDKFNRTLAFPMALLILFGWALPQLLSSGVKKQRTTQSGSVPRAVKEFLAQSDEDETAVSKLFLIGDEAVPSLVKSLRSPDKDIKRHAARGLAYIGNEQGVAALRSAIVSETDVETKSAFYYFLAGGLVQTKSRRDVDLLTRFVSKAIAAKEDADDIENAPAITSALALAMRGRTEALPTLRMAAKLDLVGSEEVSKAVDWLESDAAAEAQTRTAESGKPLKLDDKAQVEETILRNTFFAEAKGDEVSLSLVQFNSTKTKVLVSLEIGSGPRDHRSYDLVLTKEDSKWRVNGIWLSGIA
jgi:hypothetical protein